MQRKPKATMIFSVITLACSLIVLPVAVAVSEVSNQVNININGQALNFLEGDQFPVIMDERTYVPLRVISENMGARVDWCQDTQQVIISTQGESAAVPVAKTNRGLEIIIDGKALSIDLDYGRPYISNLNRTMVPLRAVGEALNCEVDWEDKSKTVLITFEPKPEPKPEIIPPAASETGNDIGSETGNDNSNLLKQQLLTELASYKSNLKLMDGSVIQSEELLNRDVSTFTPAQLEVFQKYCNELRKYPQTFMLPGGETVSLEELSILGTSVLTAEQLNQYISNEAPRIKDKMKNMGRAFVPIPDVAALYIRIGAEYGIRGDIAYCQAVKETGYFQFTGSVQPWQNNYCGLWATGSPLSGNESFNGADPAFVRFEPGCHGVAFVSPEAGVEAHIQHLYAYAVNKPLPAGKVIIDPRFSLVKRGISPGWQQLNARWAVPGTSYGQSILCDYWLKAFPIK